MITLKIEACGKTGTIRVLTPRTFTRRIIHVHGHRRLTWQIDYVKHIVLSLLVTVRELCLGVGDPVVEVTVRDAVRLVEKVRKKIGVIYCTRRGRAILDSITIQHVERALRELRGEIERWGFDEVCRRYLALTQS